MGAVGNVLDRVDQLHLRGTEAGSSYGVYAPTLRHHDGRFWMITTVVAHGRERFLDNFFVTAEDPAGPWSDPVRVDLPGIDPDLAWDDEGNCWVHFGAMGIYRCRIDDRTGEVLDGPELAWSGTGLQYPEGPHLLRRGDHWYLLIAEGGTERGHAVSIARGPAPIGPWESCPANPILSHRSTDRPIQNTGHADLVQAADGSWWMVLLGARPMGPNPGFHVLGPETFLTPVDWVDGWPVPGDVALDMPVFTLPAVDIDRVPSRDEFDRPVLAPAWVGVRTPPAVSLEEQPGFLTLRGGGATLDDAYPAFLGRRQADPTCLARTSVERGDAGEVGLVVRMDEQHHYEVFVADREIAVRARIGPLSEVVGRRPCPEGELILRVEAVPDGGEPDRLRMGYESPGGDFKVLADLPGPVPLHRGRRLVHRAGHRRLRRGQHGAVRLVRAGRAPGARARVAANGPRPRDEFDVG